MMSAHVVVFAGTIDTSNQEPYEQCGYCHEYDGNSIMQNYPKLAGQQKKYLVKQLLDFKTGKRKSLMQTTAELLTEQDIEEVATYFSRQIARSNSSSTPQAEFADAKNIFMQGDTKRGLVACTDCHSGMTESAIPRLFGQHAKYLSSQLVLFKNGMRNNDENRTMRNIAKELTFSEIQMISKYLSGSTRANSKAMSSINREIIQ